MASKNSDENTILDLNDSQKDISEKVSQINKVYMDNIYEVETDGYTLAQDYIFDLTCLGEEAVDEIAGYLGDESWYYEIPNVLANIASRTGSLKAVTHLVDGMIDGSSASRYSCYESLCEISKEDQKLKNHALKCIVRRMSEVMGDDFWSDSFDECVIFLREFKGIEAKEILISKFHHIKGEHYVLKLDVAKALVSFGVDNEVVKVISPFVTENKESIQRDAKIIIDFLQEKNG